MDNNNCIVNDAENTLNIFAIKKSVEQLKDFAPQIAKLTKLFYEEQKKVGFTDAQAFEFAKEYSLKLLFQ